ncbi:MAG: tRNA(Leu) C34 or U34 (ribose-2'-O)-methylase TrmL [Planctomycetota bacterium]|jgi:tRNA(Leu) C34 or U34 (ribose-2'-O)-methylase TrmL
MTPYVAAFRLQCYLSAMTVPDLPPLRLRRAESVLMMRTSRVVLVLEHPWNDDNVLAVLRTAESFGVQNIWTVGESQGRRRAGRRITKGSHEWLTLREFADSESLLRAVGEEGLTLWVSDLSSDSERLDSVDILRPMPDRIALVLGREVDGVGPVLMQAAQRRFYLPMRGFTESFNLSVATALLLQRLFDADPGLIAAMSEAERAEIRESWYPRLGGRDERKQTRFIEYLAHPPAPLDDTRPPDEHRRPRFKKRAYWRRDE